MKFPLYLVIMKADNKYYVLADKPGIVSVFETQERALGFFEKAYDRNHKRSFVSSMSACLNWMCFQPSIIKMNSHKEIMDLFENGQTSFVNIRGVSGGFCGAVSNIDLSKMFENGIKPELIKEIIK